MPSLRDNRRHWSSYAWPHSGDEWSIGWGGTPYLWHGTIAPRIAAAVPTGHILEIGPGRGRCTQFLLALCRQLTIVDLVRDCIDHCRQRFRDVPHVRCIHNDGRSLAMIPDASVDFAFSWDSLVHAEADVLDAYISQLGTKLRPGGLAFFHHSNIGQYRDASGRLMIDNPHWRATSVTAAVVRELCTRAGLWCLVQEIVPWGGDEFNDCFTYFARPEQPGPAPPTRVVRHDAMGQEVSNLRRLADLYRPLARPDKSSGTRQVS